MKKSVFVFVFIFALLFCTQVVNATNDQRTTPTLPANCPGEFFETADGYLAATEYHGEIVETFYDGQGNLRRVVYEDGTRGEFWDHGIGWTLIEPGNI